ncbi:hypothetical protein WMF27_00520 [Sorangium sp. So ce281]
MTLPDGTRLEFVYDGFARRIEKRVLQRDAAMARHRYRWDGEDLLEEMVEREASATGASAPFTLVARSRSAGVRTPGPTRSAERATCRSAAIIRRGPGGAFEQIQSTRRHL